LVAKYRGMAVGWRRWTDPELMKQWFAPKPFTVPVVETDLRAGGSSLVVMRDPDGNDYPNPGVHLEVVPNEKIVFTDAFAKAWEPALKPFMVATVTLEDSGGGKTRCTAAARSGALRPIDQFNAAETPPSPYPLPPKTGGKEGCGRAAN